MTSKLSRSEYVIRIISQLTKSAKRKYVLSRLFSITFISLNLILWIDDLISPETIILIVIVLFAISITLILNSKQYKNITDTNVLEHINRALPVYQESSQVIRSKNDTSPIKSILKEQVIEQLLIDEKSGLLKNCMPAFQWKSPTLFFLIFIISIYSIKDFTHFASTYFSNIDDIDEPSKIVPKNVDMTAVEIQQVIIDISPPEYTKIKDKMSTELNFQVIENSIVAWSVKFNTKVLNAYILFTTTENQTDSQSLSQSNLKNRMEYDSENNVFVFRKKISSTQIYRIEVEKNNLTVKPILIEGVFTISINKDLPPRIKIVSPKESLTEFSKNTVPIFTLEANISDDYDISNVVIQASVAKGSGEAVKFRDKSFEFDSVDDIKIKNNRTNYRYIKKWSLNDLDMEPGDEVYFHVIATDNRIPEKQSTKSSSTIVRWLDDNEMEVAAEGLRISFVPEYFRSQRQIIIETIELIEDRGDLDITIFEERSVDLGHSQGDLKVKYGQYLGDEVGEGEGASLLHDSVDGGLEIEATSHEEEHAHELEEVEDDNNLSNNRRSASSLIAEFTHNHSSIEVAPLSKRDPKTWMKMAVNEMWQAELHLMLSEPVKALPFEQKAYKYLKLARKADRIYAKRLGFEPPPVTEERRLTGELDEVKSSTILKQAFSDVSSSQLLYRSSYKIINQWQLLDNITREKSVLDDSQLKTLRELKHDILQQTKSRPVLIKYVAILEKISITKTLLLRHCESCINDLQARLWNFLSSPKSIPKTLNRTIGISKENEIKYLQSFNSLINTIENKAAESRNE